ncbi:branched-chain amino acid ABC transporter permease [Primorskyibacter flagellatus]|uniref:Branched-chain amino acid ABC transporter permease n=1 Tax=Primorskyibacter flagellatus TaxID=1387277 RepID=A0A917AHC5_9RHOB|nr:branched-chain amino acid ABC transporter permease [Primorskyibacter flagellatus]GGE51083.1 branched-chain amino acid ABC transporter permease [Primorskyibacter flagellatus]
MSDQVSHMPSPPSALSRLSGLATPGVTAVVLVTLLLFLPALLGGSWTFTLGLCFANSIGVLAVSLLVRYGGEVSIGHTFFTALGAYSVGVLDTRYGISLWASVPLALVLGVAFGLLFAWPSRNLHGIYLAVTTLALALAVPEMINNFDGLTGGYEGLYVATPFLPGVDMGAQRYYVALAMLVLVCFAVARLRLSRQGMALLLAKTHPAAADAFGTRRVWARISVMGISGGVGALCGATLAFSGSTVSPGGFTFWQAIFLLVGSVVSFYGLSLPRVLIGGAFVTLVPQLLSASGAWIPVLYGLALLGMILIGHYMPRIRKALNRNRETG